MAFMKYADARVVTPNVSKTEWRNVRVASKKEAAETTSSDLSDNLIERASEFLGVKEFDPSKYLLTHCTIIASVDTYTPSGMKTGSVTVEGFKVNRKFSNFRIKTKSESYINNNKDAWDRPVLLKAYRTFIGGHNFVEHVQVEELSKGRIIDAVARDIGDSIYVDILIATDRKHKDLVKSIESGKMGTLSMGCTVDGTICTKCGHWAADETEMCPHIKYAKGNTFFDDDGKQNQIAELCGHDSIGDTGGVQFIEASWVETPAFTGAVMRNVLEFDAATAKKAKKVLAMPPPEWSADAKMKAASFSEPVFDVILPKKFATPARQSVIVGANTDDMFLAGWMDEGGEEGGGEEAPAADPASPPVVPSAPTKAPFQDVEDDAYNQIKDRIRDRFKKDLAPAAPTTPVSTNETLNKQAAFARKAYVAGLNDIVHTASSDVSLIDRVAAFNRQVGINISVDLYRASLKVGSTDQYGDPNLFARACRQALGRNPNMGETKTLIRLGKLICQRNALAGNVK
jgi:hypothetical protein